METKIKSISIANSSWYFYVGMATTEGAIGGIVQEDIYYLGNPYPHFVAYNMDNDKIISINCLIPCVIEYYQTSI